MLNARSFDPLSSGTAIRGLGGRDGGLHSTDGFLRSRFANTSSDGFMTGFLLRFRRQDRTISLEGSLKR